MKVLVYPNASAANKAAAGMLVNLFRASGTRNVMVAAGNTPLELYRLVAEHALDLSRLEIFALDEYVGVPPEEPRNCANLIRKSVMEAWNIPASHFHAISSLEETASESISQHEERIHAAGGLDVIILGLGQNGHLGFNEPGSAEDSEGRMLDLQPISVEVNRTWFGGKFAPSKGVTVGLKTILAARHVVILAFGTHKKLAVAAMVEGPRSTDCPASLLQGHADVSLFLDVDAAAGLKERT